ncbi:protease I [Nocardioides sp. J9]|uniref:type 1 glutamine amidotransferase domain-containing protein n=1 Tax=unclassified Nocardioides TaxID=2615069 RepID=UPI00048B677B|nr:MULTISPECIES: type 1 glutamine amidotransferase domain-containing protein [unclassified Nocardioides]TWG94851.1 protease I [Nocardioides sp. J9]
MPDLTGKRVAIIAGDYVEEPELVGPRDRLRESGAEVLVLSADGSSIQAAEGDVNPTREIEVDGSFDDVDVDSLDAVVVPGGTVNADQLRSDARAQTIVRTIDAAGKPLASICHGPWLLVSAGLVEGRRLTSWSSLQDDVRNAGGSWVDAEVVVDRNLVTSRKPDDVPAFVEALEKLLGTA